jgi:hypothetical protein
LPPFIFSILIEAAHYTYRKSSGNFATFAAIRRASSRAREEISTKRDVKKQIEPTEKFLV